MRWGLIGASTIASDYVIKAIRAQDGHDIRTVMSSSAERGREYAVEHSIPVSVTDLDAVIEDPEIDAVYISTTNEKHFAQAIAAIEAGKHILCEKPLAMTVDEAVEMVRAARDRGVIFATNHHLRCAGSHMAIRDLIGSRRLGEILSVRVFHAVYLPAHLQGWRINDAKAGGGVILDITVHDADTVRFHLGEDPQSVVAKAGVSGLGQSVEDSVMSIWSMSSGVMVQTHDSFTHHFAATGVEINGSEATVVARNVMSQKPVGEIFLIDNDGRHPVPFSDHDLYVRALEHFSRAVSGSGSPAADGVDGVKSLAVALAVRKAARSGRSTEVEYGGI
jgi:1,5-anhydro-D-fructose reductase (1,5-anhydro-D-mannitol-forming)